MGETRQRYNDEFKLKTVKYIQEQTKSLPQIADELNIPAGTLQQWMAKHRKFEDEPLLTPEALREKERQIERQAKEIADLQEEIEILKRLCTSSAKKRTKVPIHCRSSLQLRNGEDVQRSRSVEERLLQVGPRKEQ